MHCLSQASNLDQCVVTITCERSSGQSLDRDSGPVTLKETLELRVMKPFFTELPENGNDEAFVNCDLSIDLVVP